MPLQGNVWTLPSLISCTAICCHSLLKLLNTTKSLGTGYLPPDQGPLLDVLYDTNKEEMIKNLLLESKIFGVTIFGDGATITNVPLMNISAGSPNNRLHCLRLLIVQIKWQRVVRKTQSICRVL